jgi:thiamine biosynthesis lipoprotein
MTGAHGSSRRAFLRVLASAVALPLGVLALGRAGAGLRGAPAPVVWTSEALGARVQLTLWHPQPERARALTARMGAELARLNRIFDLHDPRSELARLNAEGRLSRPSADLRAALGLGLTLAEQSGGAFDPTIQPLWRARYLGADISAQDRARSLVGWRHVEPGRTMIRFARPGMQITLNGMAQGHAADRLALMLADAGLTEALIDAGEIRALGGGPDGKGHAVALVDPTDPRRLQAGSGLRLAEVALAVSGGYGLRLPDGGHHILDPASGRSAGHLVETVVSHPQALVADALSTALYVAGPQQAARLLEAYPGAGARLRDARGHLWHLGQGAAAQAIVPAA